MVFPTHIVAAAGVTTNTNGEVLLVKTHHGGWVFPGGQVENGENLIDAVIRETKEESGVDIEVGKLFCISSNTGEHPGYNGVKVIPTKVMMDFICVAVGGETCISEENSETGWFQKDKVLEMISAPAIVERFKAYLEFDGNIQYLEYITKPEFTIKSKLMI